MVTGKVGTKIQPLLYSFQMWAEDKGEGKYLPWDFKIDNWWNVKKTADSSTVRYVPEPTNNKKSEKERMFARSKEQLRGDEREKGWLLGGPCGYGEAPTRSKVPKYLRVSPLIHTISGVSPGQSFIQNKSFLKSTLILSSPSSSCRPIKKINRSLWSTDWF